jgi:hypothetical protein
MVKTALHPLCDLAGPEGARSYGYDKARYFFRLSEFDVKRPSSRQDSPYIVGIPIDVGTEGDGHDFRTVTNDRRLVTTAAFRRVAKTKPGAFDPRTFVSVARGRCVGHRAM